MHPVRWHSHSEASTCNISLSNSVDGGNVTVIIAAIGVGCWLQVSSSYPLLAMLHPLAIIDLLSWAPSLVGAVFPLYVGPWGLDLRWFRVFRFVGTLCALALWHLGIHHDTVVSDVRIVRCVEDLPMLDCNLYASLQSHRISVSAG